MVVRTACVSVSSQMTAVESIRRVPTAARTGRQGADALLGSKVAADVRWRRESGQPHESGLQSRDSARQHLKERCRRCAARCEGFVEDLVEAGIFGNPASERDSLRTCRESAGICCQGVRSDQQVAEHITLPVRCVHVTMRRPAPPLLDCLRAYAPAFVKSKASFQ